MTVELTDEGLSTSSFEEIRDAKGERLRAKFGANLDLSPTESIMGQLVNIQAEQDALTEEAILAVYRSADPQNSFGRPLDARLGYTGTTRNGATYSEVEGLLAFGAADTYNAGSLVRNNDTNDLWRLTTSVVAAGAGSYAATLQAVDAGPKLAAAGSSWTLVTVNPNVTGFTNPTDDADPGRLRETDAAAKARSRTELYSQNIGGTAAISAAISRFVNAQSVGTVLVARTYHNTSIIPADADGIPFKAFNPVLELSPSVPDAATQQAIVNAIGSAIGAGGQSYGTSYTGSWTDREGKVHSISFDVVTQANIVVEVDLVTTTTESVVSENIEAVVAAAILTKAQASYEVSGRDVTALDISGIVWGLQEAGTISGVDGVAVRLAVDPASPAAVTKLDIGIRQKPDFDSANITVAQV